MLFHITMTHSADNCPSYHPEIMPETLASLERLDAVAKETGVNVHSLVWGAPEHVAYAVLEADNLVSIGKYLNSIAITQDYRITPVEHVSDVVEYGKAAMAQKKQR